MDLLAFLASARGSSLLTWAWISFTIAFALYVWVRFWGRARKIDAELRSACNDLRNLLDAPAARREFETLGQSLEQPPLLRDSWMRFRDSLMIHREAPQIHSHRDPTEFFDFEELLQAARINTRMLSVTPSLLTGLGILGTFVGLTVGIAALNSSMQQNANDVATLMSGVQSLLRGASLAFWTSIAGLLCSFVFSVLERRKTNHLAEQFEDLLEQLRRLFPLRTLESINSDLLRESTEQTAQLARFNTDLAVSIATALESRLNATLVPPITAGMGSVVEAIDAMRSDRSQSTEAALARALDDFKQSLTANAGTEMDSMRQTFGHVDGALRTAIDGIGQAERTLRTAVEMITQRLDSGLTDTATRFGDAVSNSVVAATELMLEQSRSISSSLSEMTETLKRTFETSASDMGDRVRGAVTDAADTLAKQSQGMGETMRQGAAGLHDALAGPVEEFAKAGRDVREALGALSSVLARAKQAHDSQVTLLERFDAAHKSLAGIAAPLGEAARQIADGGRQSAQASVAMQGASTSLSHASDKIMEHQTVTTQAWAEYRERFETVDASLARAFEQLNSGLASFAGKTQEYVQGLNKEMANALTLLNAAVSELEETVDALAGGRGRSK